MLDPFIRIAVRFLLWLRYRVRINGLDDVVARGTGGILFLPNHPALIDPVILATYLQKTFAPRFMADEQQIDRPVIRSLARRNGVYPIPNMVQAGVAGRERIEQALSEIAADLRAGKNLVLYPAGHAMRSFREDLRGNSGVETILRRAPNVRIVLVRTVGLWGSGFSWASGRPPRVAATLFKGAGSLLISGVFFAPRREVSIELVEPTDLPRNGDRETLNRYLEEFYNATARHRLHVPHSIWERGGPREMPEAKAHEVVGDISAVPDSVRKQVLAHLKDVTGIRGVHDDMHLARDLGMDSLMRADLLVWLGGEFGFHTGDVDSIQWVKDVLLAACGEFVASGPQELRPVPAGWFDDDPQNPRVHVAEGETIAAVVLNQARRAPGKVIIADQTSGAKTWRDLITAVMVLKPHLERMSGDPVGIMLPASVAADTVYLAALFAGKTPVMVNWTVGPRNVSHCLDHTGVAKVITSEVLVKRLAGQGIDLSSVEDRFVHLEKLAQNISLRAKLWARLKAYVCWTSLSRAKVSSTAAVLFTSGSENLPKAVPLTHANILANVRDVTNEVAIHANDRMLGMLPPFHSFGLGENIVLPLCVGIRVAYHPNPTEGAALGRLIEAYKLTLLIGTPSFLNGIVRASTREMLATLRFAVTGAEKCSGRVYEALRERCTGARILEGYGVTECSPIICVNSERHPVPFSIGKVLPSFAYALVDPETGERGCAKDTPAMLLVRGPSVFGGYLDYDGPSPFVECDGQTWYRTGDLVKEGADGVLTFCGRLKRFVKIGGEMISLPAIESVLIPHYPSDEDKGPVLAVGATGSEDHPELVLFTTLEMDRETVNRQIREAGLSPLHNVRQVVRLDEIPVLGTGKTDYRALRENLSKGVYRL